MADQVTFVAWNWKGGSHEPGIIENYADKQRGIINITFPYLYSNFEKNHPVPDFIMVPESAWDTPGTFPVSITNKYSDNPMVLRVSKDEKLLLFYSKQAKDIEKLSFITDVDIKKRILLTSCEIHRQKVLVCVWHGPNISDEDNKKSTLTKLLKYISDECTEKKYKICILGGDFNLELMQKDCSNIVNNSRGWQLCTYDTTDQNLKDQRLDKSTTNKTSRFIDFILYYQPQLSDLPVPLLKSNAVPYKMTKELKEIIDTHDIKDFLDHPPVMACFDFTVDQVNTLAIKDLKINAKDSGSGRGKGSSSGRGKGSSSSGGRTP